MDNDPNDQQLAKEVIVRQVIEAVKARITNVEAVRGRPRSQLPSTTHLQMEEWVRLAPQSNNASKPTEIQTIVLPTPFPPCKRSYTELEPILIKDLLLETRVDRVLFARRIGPMSSSAVGSTYGIMDRDGTVELLVSDAFSFAGPEVIPEGAVLAIKHPYCQVNLRNMPWIKVSHPSDLHIILEPSIPNHIPQSWFSIDLHRNAPLDEPEETPGDADQSFACYLDSTNTHYDPDCVEVQPSSLHGRGLFSRKASRKGALLLMERACFTSFARDSRSFHALKFDLHKRLMTEDITGAPYKELARRLCKDSDLRRIVYGLDSGEIPAPGPPELLVDGEPVIDIFHLNEVFQRNAILSPALPLDVKGKFPHLGVGIEGPGCGIWAIASKMNHSCLPNTEQSIIGDSLLLYATRDIEANEELTMCYGSFDDPAEKKKAFRKNWGFRCSCELCLKKPLPAGGLVAQHPALVNRPREPSTD